ncbi:hypothetical protein D4R87_02745 [bacterium]|nr:MAG: hypothetical protein D4R87_02745 [bacterium]
MKHKIKIIGTILAISLMISFIAVPIKASAAWTGVSSYCTGECQDGICSCTLCDGFRMIKGALDWLTTVSVSLAMLTVLVAGVMYMFAGANPSLTEKAKKLLKDAVIGMGAIFFAWLMVNTVMAIAGITTLDGMWFTIVCK